MSYRQSHFDPAAGPAEVYPIVRPFDRWQWFGVVAEVVAFSLFGLWLAERAGWTSTGFDSPVFMLPFMFGGSFLLRRDPNLPAGELGERKTQLVLILVAFALIPIFFI